MSLNSVSHMAHDKIIVTVWLSRNEVSYAGQHLYPGLLIDLLKEPNNGFFLDQYPVKKYVNNIFSRFKYALIKVAPLSAVKNYKKEFTDDLVSYLDKKYADHEVTVHFLYAPETIIYNVEFNSRNVNVKHVAVISMPDYFSQYHFQLFKNNFQNLKYLIDYLLYLRLEKTVSQKSKIHVIGEKKDPRHNCTPILVSKNIAVPEQKKTIQIFVPLPHSRLLKILFEKFAIHKCDTEFVFLLRDPKNLHYMERFKSRNIKVINFIDKYDDFVSRFFIHLCYDPAGTGMSTKVATACKMGCIPFGNKAAFRGLQSVPNDWICDFRDSNSFYGSIKALKNKALEGISEVSNVEKFFKKNYQIKNYLHEIYKQ